MKKMLIALCLCAMAISLMGCLTGGREMTDQEKEMMMANPLLMQHQ
jgi:hypothetical protein